MAYRLSPASRLLIASAALCASVVAVVTAQRPTLLDNPAIAYSKSAPTDAIARLQQQLDSGAATLEFDEARGYLPSVLKHLEVSTASQGLVFSRTSLQVSHIAPWSPRALYFNDDVYVGYVKDGPIMEIASVDDKLGAVFYTLSQEKTERPTFQRETTTCLMCHNSAEVTGGVPGLIVRSMYPDRYGYSISSVGNGVTTDQTPIEQRWGGWYVTGTMGPQKHAGNILAPVLVHDVDNVKGYMARVDLGAGSQVTDLSDRFDTDVYLTPHSDIVALLVLAHQATVHNLITRAGYDARIGRPLDGDIDALVQALFFAKEAPFQAPVKGTTAFAEEFAAQGPRDAKGRSLRDLDLTTRMFRYPLSYLIYSDQFDALPVTVKTQVYAKIRSALDGEGTIATLANLSAEDRTAIREILTETKADFAEATAAKP